MATNVAEVEEASNVETLVERCAGLDVHKDSVTACVRVPDGHGGAKSRSAGSPRPPRGWCNRACGWPASR
jgi:hypothetical protein